jgi:hypothetical protein
MLFALLIAIGPACVVWLIIVFTSDPDEGANIGGGLIGLAALVLGVAAAIVFLVYSLVRSVRSPSH